MYLGNNFNNISLHHQNIDSKRARTIYFFLTMITECLTLCLTYWNNNESLREMREGGRDGRLFFKRWLQSFFYVRPYPLQYDFATPPNKWKSVFLKPLNPVWLCDFLCSIECSRRRNVSVLHLYFKRSCGLLLSLLDHQEGHVNKTRLV